MRDNWQIRNKFILLYMIIILLASVSSLVIMFFYARSKTVIVTEVLEDYSVSLEPEKTTETATYEWDLLCESGEGENIEIKCPGNVNPGNLSFSIRYDLKRVQVEITGFESTDIKDNQPNGNFELVNSGSCVASGDKALFTFNTKEVCEGKVWAEDDRVIINLSSYSKDERPVIVIDPGHGGSSVGTRAGNLMEKDITLKLAQAVERAVADRNYRVMLTRYMDENVSTVERLKICETLEADGYVGIHLSQDIDVPERFGMVSSYNPYYYDRTITNAEFAAMVLRNACISASNKALGTEASSEEDAFLEALGIPATVLYAGFMTNPDELKLLGKDAYIEMIAEGIVAALDEVYGTK